MRRHFKHPKYTYIKDNIYYFSRSIPVDLRHFYKKPRIIQSLKTKSSASAKTASNLLALKLENYWLDLRLKNLEIPAEHLFLSHGVSPAPTIEEALEIYFSVKGKDRPKLFFTTAQRNIKYLIQCLGNKPIDEYSSKDATILRDWLLEKGLGNSSLRRVFSGIKAVINLTIQDEGLDLKNPFARVYLPSTSDVQRRHPISQSNLITIKEKCLEIDDDIRWLVAIIFD